MTLILRSVFTLLALLGALAGAIYPFAVPDGAQAAFSMNAPGSSILLDGTTVGAGPISQNFSRSTHSPRRFPVNAPRPLGAAAPSLLFFEGLNPAWANTVEERIAARQHPACRRSEPLMLACLGAMSLPGLNRASIWSCHFFRCPSRCARIA